MYPDAFAMKRTVLSLVLLLTVTTSACKSAGREQRHADHQGQQVIIHKDHDHSKFCGHYMAANKWFYSARHRHGISCGHVLEAGVWILE